MRLSAFELSKRVMQRVILLYKQLLSNISKVLGDSIAKGNAICITS